MGRSAVSLSANVRVEQEQRHAADLGQPDRTPHGSAGHIDTDREWPTVARGDALEWQALRVVVGVGVLLVAVGVDGLSEVAVAVEEAHADERDGHVRRRLEVVAGEHAQAARVDAERLVQAVFGTEIGDRAVERTSVLALEPMAGAVVHVAIELVEQLRYSAIRSASSRAADQSRCCCRTGTGLRWRSQAWTSMRRNRTRTRGCHIQ